MPTFLWNKFTVLQICSCISWVKNMDDSNQLHQVKHVSALLLLFVLFLWRISYLRQVLHMLYFVVYNLKVSFYCHVCNCWQYKQHFSIKCVDVSVLYPQTMFHTHHSNGLPVIAIKLKPTKNVRTAAIFLLYISQQKCYHNKHCKLLFPRSTIRYHFRAPTYVHDTTALPPHISVALLLLIAGD